MLILRLRALHHTRHREMYLDADRDAAIAAIQAVHLPVISIKVLAAGRSEPLPAFRFALEHIKPIDAMAVGMYTKTIQIRFVII